MNIEELKQLLGNDHEINELLDETVENGFLSQDLELTEKRIANTSQLQEYSQYATSTQHIMFKVEGISLENVGLDIFDLIRDSIHSIIDMSWNTQKIAGYNITRHKYENNVNVSLKSASFQVDIELPAFAKSKIKQNMDVLVDAIINDQVDDIVIDKSTERLLKNMQQILDNPKIQGIKIGTDKKVAPKDAPQILKNKVQKIKDALETKQKFLLENQNDTNIPFDEEVIVVASDSIKKIFNGYAKEMKFFTFDCNEVENGDAWWNVIRNQIASVNDLKDAKTIKVTGSVMPNKKIKVTTVTID